MVKFIAQYRAHKDSRALNEIASTLFYLFAGFGVLAYLVVVGAGVQPRSRLPDHGGAGRDRQVDPAHHRRQRRDQFPVLASTAASAAASSATTSTTSWRSSATSRSPRSTSPSLLAGYGLVALVAATTLVRFAHLLHLPPQRLQGVSRAPHPPLVCSGKDRLREVTGFSVYSSIIDWANKLNYELDEIVIGVFLGPAPVAVWAVAERIISGTQRLTNQGNAVLFPVVVDSRSDAANRPAAEDPAEGHAAVAGDRAADRPGAGRAGRPADSRVDQEAGSDGGGARSSRSWRSPSRCAWATPRAPRC